VANGKKGAYGRAQKKYQVIQLRKERLAEGISHLWRRLDGVFCIGCQIKWPKDRFIRPLGGSSLELRESGEIRVEVNR
jgi:hypothetical protein